MAARSFHQRPVCLRITQRTLEGVKIEGLRAGCLLVVVEKTSRQVLPSLVTLPAGRAPMLYDQEIVHVEALFQHALKQDAVAAA